MKAKRFFKTLFRVVVCVAIVFVAIRFGPTVYYRFFGGTTAWISERFSEELKEKNELVVYETTVTGQETASKSAWLLGKVQEVVVPYSYSTSFVIDLSQSEVVTAGNGITVYLPPPSAAYSKLTVDEEKMKKYDWLYPLTPERYAAIKEEIEEKLYQEASVNPSYLDAAWSTAVKNMESLFQSLVSQTEGGSGITIQVIMREAVPELSVPLQADDANETGTPAATLVPATI